MNFLLRRFPKTEEKFDKGLTKAIQSQIKNKRYHHHTRMGSYLLFARTFLDIAKNWLKKSRRFRRRLEREKKRRLKRRPVVIPPGAGVA